jgi:hypothetical protein
MTACSASAAVWIVHTLRTRRKSLDYAFWQFTSTTDGNSELAVRNVENLVKKREIDYQTYVVDWDEFPDQATLVERLRGRSAW